MNRSTTLTILATTVMTAGLLSCQQETESRNPNRRVSSNKSSALSNSIIARVSKDPNNSSMGKLELVASDQTITKSSHASQIATAFNSGQPLGLKKEGMALTASNSLNGSMFALYECPPGYYSPYSTQASQTTANQPNIGIDNIFSTFSDGGGLFNNLLGGLNTSDGGGILESLSGSLQSIIGLFTSGSTGTVAIPDGQTISNYPSYGCVPVNGTTPTTVPTYPTDNNATTTTASTTATGNATQSVPTPYPYIGQVQSGPYTYYTYALPTTANGQPQTVTTSGQQN